MLKPAFKKFLKSGFTISAAGFVIALYLRFVLLTSRRRVNESYRTLLRLSKQGEPVIIAFWHGRLALPGFFRYRARPHDAVISAHSDGKIIAAVMRFIGVDSITGSSSKHGAAAVRGVLRAIKKGRIVVVTPDGPRGPREKVSGAVSALAARTGAHIVPVAFSASRGRYLKSWDRFFLPYPFSRVTLFAAEPLCCLPGNEAQCDAALEQALCRVTREADEAAGRLPARARTPETHEKEYEA